MESDILLEMTQTNARILHSVCLNAEEMIILAEETLRGDTSGLKELRTAFGRLGTGLRIVVDGFAEEGQTGLPVRARVDKAFAPHLVSAIREFEETKLNGVITQILVGMLS